MCENATHRRRRRRRLLGGVDGLKTWIGHSIGLQASIGHPVLLLYSTVTDCAVTVLCCDCAVTVTVTVTVTDGNFDITLTCSVPCCAVTVL